MIKELKKYYVYAHYTKDTNTIFYIGVGTILNLNTDKKKSKYSRAYHTANRNKFWNHVYKKHGLIVKILSEFYTKKESLSEEKKLIEELGRRIDDKGYLTNISTGGEIGPIGRHFKMSQKQRQLLSSIKSISIFIYDKHGNFLEEVKTINKAAQYCGVTYNAVYSCTKTKNYTNGYFVFKEYKGKKLSYTYKDLNFKSALSKKVITEDLEGNKLIHNSIMDCCQYLLTDRKNLKNAIKNGRNCKKHKVYFEGKISSQASKDISIYEEGSETMEKSSTPK